MLERVHFYIHKSCYQKKNGEKRNYIKITLNLEPVKFPIEESIGIKRESRWKSGAVLAAVSPIKVYRTLCHWWKLGRRDKRDEPEDLLDEIWFSDHGIIGIRLKWTEARPKTPNILFDNRFLIRCKSVAIKTNVCLNFLFNF